MTTVGECRYRQSIPIGGGGRLDIDSNYGIRKGFLPQVNYRAHILAFYWTFLAMVSLNPCTLILMTNFWIFFNLETSQQSLWFQNKSQNENLVCACLELPSYKALFLFLILKHSGRKKIYPSAPTNSTASSDWHHLCRTHYVIYNGNAN